MSYKVGDTLSTYTLLCECGQGAYGSVFLVENTFTKRRVALKIVYSQGRSCERELNGLIQYQTVCPRTNLLQIYHVEKGDDCFWYTMDAADNLSAADGGNFPESFIKALPEQRPCAPATESAFRSFAARFLPRVPVRRSTAPPCAQW